MICSPILLINFSRYFGQGWRFLPPGTFTFLTSSIPEMPTSGDLKSGDPVSNYPTPPPQRKGDGTYSPSNRLTCPQIDLKLPMFISTLQREKKEEDFEVIRGLPKVNQSWNEVFEDFPMLAQRIRRVSKVYQRILKTDRFLIYWLTEIQSDNLLYGRENEECICLVAFNIWFCG